MYKEGQKVVCINDKKQVNSSVQDITGYIKEGVEYEIKSFSSINGIRLVGINHGYFFDGEEASFKQDRFAPMEEYNNHNKAIEQLFKELNLQLN
jgi:hypothetical protein